MERHPNLEVNVRLTSREAGYLTSTLSSVLSALIWSLNIPLLGLPLYLQSQALALHAEAESSKDAYNQWVKHQADTATTMGQLPHIKPSGPRVTINPHPHRPMPDCVVAFAKIWAGYIECREIEWTFFFLPIILAFVSSASSFFQFPGANDEPITRTFTSLATFRAMASLFYIVFFHVYVQQRIKDVHFAMAYIHPRKPGAPTPWRVWIIFSFPAATTGWTVLLYMCAVASFVLRAGTAAPPSSTQLPLTVLIFAGAVADGLCMIWVVISLRGYRMTQGVGRKQKELLGKVAWYPTKKSPDTICQKIQV